MKSAVRTSDPFIIIFLSSKESKKSRRILMEKGIEEENKSRLFLINCLRRHPDWKYGAARAISSPERHPSPLSKPRQS